MTVIKVAAGVVLGLAVAWGCVTGLGYARKQLAVYQCIAATGRDSARVYEILGCMALKGWHPVRAPDGIDWAE